MTFANRVGKITVEFSDELVATGYIDGKEVCRVPIPKIITPKMLTKRNLQARPCTFGTTEIPSKVFYKRHGITPTHFCKVFNAAVYKSAVLPYKDFEGLYFRSRKVMVNKFSAVVRSHEILQQALLDGQRNLLPILLEYNASPKDLKGDLGKSVWKKLCANTFHRNKLLASRSILAMSIGLDSGALSKGLAHASHWAKNSCGVSYSSMGRNARPVGEVALFSDTRILAGCLQLPFSHAWSKRKMQEKHDEYMRLNQRRQEAIRRDRDGYYRAEQEKLSKIDLSNIFRQTTFQQGEVICSLLTTYDRLVAEGNRMKHCVAVYAKQCMDGDYVTASVSGDGENSTIGFRRTGSNPNTYVYGIDQHYGVCNRKVISQGHLDIAEIVLKHLNSLKLTKESYGQA